MFAVWSAEGRLPEVQDLPYLLSEFVSGWADPGCEKGQLVKLRTGADMMTDPIADLLTRIRNAVRVDRPYVDLPASKMKVSIVDALQREGFVWDHELIDAAPGKTLRINLKYGPNGEHVIQHIERVSKPGCRVYSAVQELKDIRQGTGIAVVSTSKGVLSNREARKLGVGGELVCRVW